MQWGVNKSMTSKSKFIQSALKKTGQIVYPNICIRCHAKGEGEIDLCNRCYQTLPWIKFACQKCGLPLPSEDAKTCGACSKREYYFDYTLVPFQFEGFIRDAVYQFKFNQKLNQGKLLAQLFLRNLEKRQLNTPDIFIPVPLYKKRLRSRGFNQALEIARIFSSELNCSLSYHDIYRNRDTSVQMELPAKKRHKNVKDAFSLKEHSIDFKNKHVCIVDDVMTTGNTVNEVSKCVRNAGTKKNRHLVHGPCFLSNLIYFQARGPKV